MNARAFWRAAGLQVVVVAIPFAVLALALPHHFFTHWGFLVGPVLWVACSLVTGRLLGVPLAFALFCAAAGGVAAVLVMLVFGHEVGIAAGIAVFAACASGHEAGESERLGAQSSTP